jgi:hypothetical protein
MALKLASQWRYTGSSPGGSDTVEGVGDADDEHLSLAVNVVIKSAPPGMPGPGGAPLWPLRLIPILCTAGGF